MRMLWLVLVAVLGLVACGDDGQTVDAGSGGQATTTTVDATTTTLRADSMTGDISLTVTVVSEGAPLREATITCDADGAQGTGFLAEAPAAETACDLLRTNPSAITRLVQGRDPGLMCTQQYGGPEEATVEGTFDGRRISASVHRRDGCGIAEWNLLTPLLGSPGT
jgi:hypothetical protein